MDNSKLDFEKELKRFKKANRSYKMTIARRFFPQESSDFKAYDEVLIEKCLRYLEYRLSLMKDGAYQFPEFRRPDKKVKVKGTPPFINGFNEGDVLSETTFYVIEKSQNNTSSKFVELKEIKSGECINVSKSFIERNIKSADNYNSIAKVSRSNMVEIIKKNPYTAMTVSFKKKVDEKDIISKIMEVFSEHGNEQDIKRSVRRIILNAGEDRDMKGYHKGSFDLSGRLHFNIVETNRISDVNSIRLIDPRTVYKLVVDGTLYILK